MPLKNHVTSYELFVKLFVFVFNGPVSIVPVVLFCCHILKCGHFSP